MYIPRSLNSMKLPRMFFNFHSIILRMLSNETGLISLGIPKELLPEITSE